MCECGAEGGVDVGDGVDDGHGVRGVAGIGVGDHEEGAGAGDDVGDDVDPGAGAEEGQEAEEVVARRMA